MATKAVLATKAEVIAREKAVRRTCRGPLAKGAREKINQLLSGGKDEAARTLDESSRQRCGHDLNEIFLTGPLDGEIHKYKCPSCGVDGTYRAALAV